jgi:hypothetical protein
MPALRTLNIIEAHLGGLISKERAKELLTQREREIEAERRERARERFSQEIERKATGK